MMMDFRKHLQGSSCLALCFLIVITRALGIEHEEVPLSPLVEEDHHHLVSGFSIVKRAASELFCDFRRIFGWCQDHGKDRQKRSFPKERTQPQDDNTNPDEPNPKILVRVPRRQKRRGRSPKSRGGKGRPSGRVASLDKKPKRIRFSKKGGTVTAALLKNRRFGGRGGRKSKRVVVNGKWYGPKKKRIGNGTEPPPIATDHLAHLRKPLTGAALEKQQRRFVNNKGYRLRKAKKERARKGNERMAKLRNRKGAEKEEDSFDSYSSSAMSSSSSSFSDGGSASSDESANFGSSSSTDEVKKPLPKRPPKPKFAWHKHKYSNAHSPGRAHGHTPGHAHGHTHGNKKGHTHGNKKGQRKKTFRTFKMSSRGRR